MAETRDEPAGLQAIYTLSDFFLNRILQTYTVGQLLDDCKVQEISDLQSCLSDWKSWIVSYIGLIIVLLSGILLAFVIILRGFCFCCCKRKKSEDKVSDGKVAGCGFGLMLFTAVLISLASLSLALTQVLNEEIRGGKATDDVKLALRTVDDYTNATVTELNTQVDKTLAGLHGDILTIFNGLGKDVMQEVLNTTGVQPTLDILYNYTTILLPELAKELDNMGNLTVNMTQYLQDLEDSLTKLDSAMQACASCSTVQSSVAIEANFTLVDSVVEEKLLLQSMLSNPLDAIGKCHDEITNMTMKVDQSLEDVETQINKTFTTIRSDVSNSVNDLEEPLDKLKLTQYEDDVDEFQVKQLHAKTKYVFIGLFVLFSILLLPPVLYILGLSTLCCRMSQGQHGARCLKAGLLLFFLVGWLVALVTMAVLIVGAIPEILICRHAVDFDDDMARITDLIMKEVDLGYNVSAKTAYDGCKQNQSLYQSLQLHNLVPLDDVFKSFDVSSEVQDKFNVSVPVTDISFSESINSSDIQILMDNLTSINFTSYYLQLNATHRTVHNVSEYLLTLPRNDISVSDNISVVNTSLKVLQSGADLLYSSTRAAEVLVHQVKDMPQLVNDLSAAQEVFNKDKETQTQKVLSDTSGQVVTLINGTASDFEEYLQYSLSACGALYDAYTLLVNSVCEHVINPLNALWFTTGWYVMFGLLAIVFATTLAAILNSYHDNNKVCHDDGESHGDGESLHDSQSLDEHYGFNKKF